MLPAKPAFTDALPSPTERRVQLSADISKERRMPPCCTVHCLINQRVRLAGFAGSNRRGRQAGFLPMSAGKRRASPFSAVDRLISWCVTGVDDYCWCASVTSHHGPAKPAFCRYRQEKLVSYKSVTNHVHLLVQTGSICGDICEEVACCGN